jgi:DNA-binding IclR family transcriptional regulator
VKDGRYVFPFSYWAVLRAFRDEIVLLSRGDIVRLSGYAYNTVSCALSTLNDLALVTNPSRGRWEITAAGLAALNKQDGAK